MVRLANSKRGSAEAYPHGRWEEGALIYLVLSPLLLALVAGRALARVLVRWLKDLLSHTASKECIATTLLYCS